MTVEPFPQWLRPPPGGFVAEDLDRLPDLPPHTELIDGSLVFVSPQAKFHVLMTTLLDAELRRFVPEHLRVRREMTVTLGRHQRPEPDVVVVLADRDGGPDLTAYQAEDVVMAVEVVSAESRFRDRERKPQLYAGAGITHFWRVENTDGRPVVYVYELDPATRAYALTGIHHERLNLSVPFKMDIDLTKIDRI
ncbi:Endonuclease, Uma2 family (restriction endonuclease fold) [Nocardia amikacinitolerans]|uniref:Uma2 family endonuclease n=1 Tax=Nocardia amikacinitolerans TaxID=756689 RepID=UPI00082CEB05|nr:Uma2 family endonuclease [Nocardia amikacinitolerans]MCP2318546.1 Endonuclease, Uma2 family (restriction endonuclease fold) [Nocardia amikacinitolerans]